MFWVLFIFGLAAIAAWVNFRRLSKNNVRRGLRVGGLFIALYTAVVYGLVILGVIPEFQIGTWLFFFQGVILTYIIAEALNG